MSGHAAAGPVAPSGLRTTRPVVALGWSVRCGGGPGALLSVEIRRNRLRVAVGELCLPEGPGWYVGADGLGPGGLGPGEALPRRESLTRLSLFGDGRVRVTSHLAPAVTRLSAAGDPELLPAVPGRGPALAGVAVGDVLVVHTASYLEVVDPQALAGLRRTACGADDAATFAALLALSAASRPVARCAAVALVRRVG
ncbi:MAG: hypothetical protein ACOYY2_11350 [Actinomycetota bacterium]